MTTNNIGTDRAPPLSSAIPAPPNQTHSQIVRLTTASSRASLLQHQSHNADRAEVTIWGGDSDPRIVTVHLHRHDDDKQFVRSQTACAAAAQTAGVFQPVDEDDKGGDGDSDPRSVPPQVSTAVASASSQALRSSAPSIISDFFGDRRLFDRNVINKLLDFAPGEFVSLAPYVLKAGKEFNTGIDISPKIALERESILLSTLRDIASRRLLKGTGSSCNAWIDKFSLDALEKAILALSKEENATFNQTVRGLLENGAALGCGKVVKRLLEFVKSRNLFAQLTEFPFQNAMNFAAQNGHAAIVDHLIPVILNHFPHEGVTEKSLQGEALQNAAMAGRGELIEPLSQRMIDSAAETQDHLFAKMLQSFSEMPEGIRYLMGAIDYAANSHPEKIRILIEKMVQKDLFRLLPAHYLRMVLSKLMQGGNKNLFYFLIQTIIEQGRFQELVCEENFGLIFTHGYDTPEMADHLIFQLIAHDLIGYVDPKYIGYACIEAARNPGHLGLVQTLIQTLIDLGSFKANLLGKVIDAAASTGDEALIQYLLQTAIKQQCLSQISDEFENAISKAASSGHLGAVRLLVQTAIEQGIFSHFSINSIALALSRAAVPLGDRARATFSFLIQTLVEQNRFQDLTENDFAWALHSAIKNGNLDRLAYLVKRMFENDRYDDIAPHRLQTALQFILDHGPREDLLTIFPKLYLYGKKNEIAPEVLTAVKRAYRSLVPKKR